MLVLCLCMYELWMSRGKGGIKGFAFRGIKGFAFRRTTRFTP